MLIIRWSAKNRHLQISNQLLEMLGYPHILILERTPTGIVLYQRGDRCATGKERKVNYPARAMPRLGVGLPAAEELGLVEGRYQARVEGGAIWAEPDRTN